VQRLPAGLEPRLFSGLNKAEVASLLASARHQVFRAGSVIIHQGDMGDRFFLLTSGRGRCFVVTKNGRDAVLWWLTTGQIVGAVAILANPSPYLSNAEVLEDSCGLVWRRQAIRECASRYPRLLDNSLTIAYAEHIAWLVSMQISLMQDDARGRVAHLLISLACAIGKPNASGNIEVQITNADIAAGANVRHWTVGRVLAEWEKAGTIRKRRGAIVLLKMMNLGSR
jgi:CRP-like cAMP-binding protein